jgi:hypothetical protein
MMRIDSDLFVQLIAIEPGIVGSRFSGNLKILSGIALLECGLEAGGKVSPTKYLSLAIQ